MGLALHVHHHPLVATREIEQVEASHLASEPTKELLRQTLEETKELVRLEFKLARQEVQEDVRRLKLAAILGGAAAVLGILVLATLVVAVVLAAGATVAAALGTAAVLMLLTGTLALVAYKKLPGVPLERTRARLESDINQLREHVT